MTLELDSRLDRWLESVPGEWWCLTCYQSCTEAGCADPECEGSEQ